MGRVVIQPAKMCGPHHCPRKWQETESGQVPTHDRRRTNPGSTVGRALLIPGVQAWGRPKVRPDTSNQRLPGRLQDHLQIGPTDWQKLDAIKRFARPRLTYLLHNMEPPISWATSIDRETRSLAKKHLKLPRRTVTPFLYSSTRAGGLGLPNIEDEIHFPRPTRSSLHRGTTSYRTSPTQPSPRRRRSAPGTKSLPSTSSTTLPTQEKGKEET